VFVADISLEVAGRLSDHLGSRDRAKRVVRVIDGFLEQATSGEFGGGGEAMNARPPYKRPVNYPRLPAIRLFILIVDLMATKWRTACEFAGVSILVMRCGSVRE